MSSVKRQKVMTQPINQIFRLLQNVSAVVAVVCLCARACMLALLLDAVDSLRAFARLFARVSVICALTALVAFAESTHPVDAVREREHAHRGHHHRAISLLASISLVVVFSSALVLTCAFDASPCPVWRSPGF